MARRKTGSIIMVKGRLRAHLQLNLITPGTTPLLLNRGSRVMENDGESLRCSVMVLSSPGLLFLLLFVLPSPEIQPAAHSDP